MNELNVVYNEDCLAVLERIADKSIDFVCIDPPYSIAVKGEDWDFWKWKKKLKEYWEFMHKCFDEVVRVLKDNGNFLFFHNDFRIWAELNTYLEAKGLNYKGVVHLVKPWFRAISWKTPWKDNNLKSFFNITEQFFYYTFHNTTWLDTIMKNRLFFKDLKKYAHDLLTYIGKNKGEVVKEIWGQADHFFRTDYKFINAELGNRKSEHFFYWANEYEKFINNNINDWQSQRWLCTKETYDILIDKYKIDKYEWYKTFEELQEAFNYELNWYMGLRNDLERIRPIHNLDVEHNNVWQWSKYNSWKLHPTMKPEAIMERIIKTFTNEGHTVIDFFAWSGSTLVACQKLKRNYIGVEQDPKYFNVILKRLWKELPETNEENNPKE